MGSLTFAQMKARVTGDGVSDADAGTYVNAKYVEGVTEAKYLEKEITLGTTVANQSIYVFPGTDIVQIEYAYVGDVPYDRVGLSVMKALHAGRDFLSDTTRGAVAPAFTSDGAFEYDLYPTPSDTGTAITGVIADEPTPLANPTDTAITPTFFDQAIIDGARALVFDEQDERGSERDRLEARFDRAVERLRRQKNARIGRGPTQAKIAGVHF